MLRYILVFICILAFCEGMNSQTSIHMEEAQKYAELGLKSQSEYDEINGFIYSDGDIKAGDLEKIVFGYHPYWGGSNYLNYQWELLSDLSYFSYEVDPATGGPSTIHDWLTSPAIDSAFVNGARVHLCVTLFSGHSTFFNNPDSRQNLTHTLIQLVKERGAQGVSFDFEAVPSSQGENMVNYVGEFAAAFNDSLPEGMISIAMPAVDWGGIFDVGLLNEYIDLYMIMGYDYYWNGSSTAGPVDPHYSMTSGYDHNVSRTISYYQSEGMPLDRMLIGVPYYAREWPTASGTAPSAVTGYGDAYTWAKIRNNSSGNYSTENKRWEPNSFSPYFAYNDNGWYQCFVNNTYSLGRRYKIVNQRGLAGIGIWALGYDNGYTDLWETINQNFAQGIQITLFDTLYDSGGPSWNYYNGEDYTITIHGMANEAVLIQFTEFNLETGYDSLWVYQGYFPGGELLGGYTGNDLPLDIYSFLDVMSIRFRSDHNTTAGGWTAMVQSFPITVKEEEEKQAKLTAYPNPATSVITIESASNGTIQLYSIEGKIVWDEQKNSPKHKIDVSGFPKGIYLIVFSNEAMRMQRKIVKY